MTKNDEILETFCWAFFSWNSEFSIYMWNCRNEWKAIHIYVYLFEPQTFRIISISFFFDWTNIISLIGMKTSSFQHSFDHSFIHSFVLVPSAWNLDIKVESFWKKNTKNSNTFSENEKFILKHSIVGVNFFTS